MRPGRGWLCLALIFCLALTPLSSARAAATQSGNNIITPLDDQQHLVTYAEKLEAIVGTMSADLAEDRQAIRDLVFKTQEYTAATEKEKGLLAEQNNILREQITVLKKQGTAQEKEIKVWKFVSIGAFVIGGIIGAVAAH